MTILLLLAADGLQGGRPAQEVEQVEVHGLEQDGQVERADEGIRKSCSSQRGDGNVKR